MCLKKLDISYVVDILKCNIYNLWREEENRNNKWLRKIWIKFKCINKN